MAAEIEFEVINMAPKELPVTKENGTITVDLTGYDPLTPTEFPDFSSVHGLQDLRFFSNYLKEIPDGFCEAKQLRTLIMSCSPIKPDHGLLRLPIQFRCFSLLEELHLVGNHFESFPMPICELKNVKKLYMDNCTLTKIPKEIGNMTSLTVVDFSYNSLGDHDSLPKEFFCLPNIKDLYLIDCQLNELPPEIGQMKNLEGLRIGMNKLTRLPEELFDLVNLKKLSAERNNISELSPKIGQLSGLVFLLMMENRLTTLPDKIKNLENCRHINLFDNKLTCLPRSIIDMPVLESLIVDGNNNLRSPPLDVCTRGLNSIRGYFESLASVDTQAVHSQRLKVVLLGESGAGKSSLAYALVHAKALMYPDREPHSTVGIDFYTWRPVLDGVEFHIVDCAGQRRYQLTHPFFLSSEALHILVVDLFNYKPAESCFRRTVGDWLDLVTSRILKPRVMIVPTHLDKFGSNESEVVSRCEDILDRVQHYCKSQKAQIEFEISEKKKKGLKNPVQGGTDPEWKKKNPPVISSSLHSSALPDQPCPEPGKDSYIAMVPVSNIRELTGIIALQDEIIRIAKDGELFPSVGRDLPEEWIKLEKALKECRESGQCHCMPYEHLENFAKQHANLSQMGLRSAVTYLDSIGELRYYSNIPSLHYNVFTDLRWLAKLAKCLFRHDLERTLQYDENFQKFGVILGFFDQLKEKLLKEAVLSQALLRCLWEEMDLDDNMFLQMVELLHHLGLACRLPSGDPDELNLLVPWFLSEYPDAVEGLSGSPSEDQVEINLLFMMAYLPPGLFDRLRVRCCSLEFEYYNWKDHVLLFVDDHRVLVKKHNYPPGAESTSPAIYIKGRGPKAELEALWEVLLRVVQETDALLTEWQRLSVQRFSLCPPCAQKKKSKPCIFPCNWMSHATLKMQRGTQTKMCKGAMLLRGEKFDVNLIYPPAEIIKRLLESAYPSMSEPVSEDVPDTLIADLSQQLTTQWKLVALYLGFTHDQVTTIDAENDSVSEKIIAMLNAWKQSQAKNATRSNLMKALKNAQRTDLAEKVCSYQE